MSYNIIAEARNKNKNKNKELLRAVMQTLGITSIAVEFDGSGDSGQVEGVTVVPETKQDQFDNTQTKVFRTTCFFSAGSYDAKEEEAACSAPELAEDFAYEVLEQHHGGWEINDGAYGTIIIHADGRGSIEYNQRVMETEYEETEF